MEVAGLGEALQARVLREVGADRSQLLDRILAIFESRGLANGPSEGINPVIQCAKARARGS